MRSKQVKAFEKHSAIRSKEELFARGLEEALESRVRAH
jgi:hypothetical protein